MAFLSKDTRRSLFWIILTLALVGLFGLLISQIYSPPSIASAQSRADFPLLNLTQVADGLERPVAIAHADDGSDRLFIVEQRGRIYILTEGLSAEPFLNIEDRVTSGGEQGLLGLAFPPDYGAKGYFYVYYTMKDGHNVVSRFDLTSDPDLADPGSEEQILVLPHPDQYTNHNGGQLAFGPDGYLYIGTGDGGGGGDPLDNAKDPSSLNGKLLRIDVEMSSGATNPVVGDHIYYFPLFFGNANKYAIPADNPFVDNSEYQPEIWALGLRNPWRFSFDRQTGDLYIGDVGQASWEEVNFQPVSSPGGENYGWNIMEGEECYNATTCDTTGLTLPVHAYERVGFPDECAVTGGYVYRGADHTELGGIYIFGDFCSGRIWGLQQNGVDWVHQLIASTTLRISSFGEDEAGELYVADMTGGEIFKLSVD
jgi:glucose/arabinose dehydrogenase